MNKVHRVTGGLPLLSEAERLHHRASQQVDMRVKASTILQDLLDLDDAGAVRIYKRGMGNDLRWAIHTAIGTLKARP